MTTRGLRPYGTFMIRLCLATLAIIAAQHDAQAGQFSFNTTGGAPGGQTVLLNSLSEGAGNVLAVGAQTAINTALATNSSTSGNFTAYYQANITPVDSTNHAVNVAPGQFTVVARFNEYASNISPTSSTVNFGLSSNQAGSYFEIFYNPTAASNPLAGTGFASDSAGAKLIYSGTLSGSNTGVFTNNGENTGPTPNNNLDQVTYPSPNSAVQQSVSGNGGETFYINTSYQDTNFFLSTVTQQVFSTTNDVAFHQTAASNLFIDLNPGVPDANGSSPATTMMNGSSYVTPTLPTVNGIGDFGPNASPRQDFQFEAIASSSFTVVPEPASIIMTLLGIGFAGIGRYRYNRRRDAIA